MKTQKGFIQIPLLIAIIAGVLVFGGGGYFGIQQYQNYKDEKIEQKKQAELNQKTDEEQRQKLQELLDSQSAELEKQKSAIEALKNKKPEIITQTIIKEAPAQKAGNDLPTIISQWKNRVAEVTCEWQYLNGVVYASGWGSGVLFDTTALGTIVLTNKHVILDDSYLWNGVDSNPAASCVVKVYGIGEMKVSGPNRVFRPAAGGEDWVQIELNSKTTGSSYNPFANLPNFNVCTEANLGDEVVILGYPAIGAQGGITATEGIVSGIEGNYYITSAKIDQGNSGGLAVLVKDNCYLGIPTSARLGAVESLGRIISGKYIFTK